MKQKIKIGQLWIEKKGSKVIRIGKKHENDHWKTVSTNGKEVHTLHERTIYKSFRPMSPLEAEQFKIEAKDFVVTPAKVYLQDIGLRVVKQKPRLLNKKIWILLVNFTTYEYEEN